jgi:hypothetical protein
MNLESMKNTPSSRENFDSNMFMLIHKVKNGKFFIGHTGSPIVDELLKVRRLPNGRLDMLSIDEGARLAANMCAEMEQSMPATDSINRCEESTAEPTCGSD